MGAAVALKFAIRHPDRISGLILSRPAWLIDPNPPNTRVFSKIAALIRELTPNRAAEVGKRALARILHEHSYAHRGAEVDAFLRGFRKSGQMHNIGTAKPAAAEGVV